MCHSDAAAYAVTHHAESQPQQQGRYKKIKKTHVRIRPHSTRATDLGGSWTRTKIPDDGRSQKPIKTVAIPPPRRSNIRHIASSRTCSRRQVTSSTEKDPASRRPWSSCPISALEPRQSCTQHHTTQRDNPPVQCPVPPACLSPAPVPVPARPIPFSFGGGAQPWSIHFPCISIQLPVHTPSIGPRSPRRAATDTTRAARSDELTPRLDADALLSPVPMSP